MTMEPPPGPAADPAAGETRAAADIASFVLRFAQEIWRDDQGAPRVRWRGRIHHVQGDDDARFTDFADAVAFIQERLAQLTMDAAAEAPPGDRELVVADGFRLWERFAESYAGMMENAVARTVERSEAYRRQVADTLERSLRAWNPLLASRTSVPDERADRPAAEADRVVAALDALRAEVRALDAKVERLARAAQAPRAGDTPVPGADAGGDAGERAGEGAAP